MGAIAMRNKTQRSTNDLSCFRIKILFINKRTIWTTIITVLLCGSCLCIMFTQPT